MRPLPFIPGCRLYRMTRDEFAAYIPDWIAETNPATARKLVGVMGDARIEVLGLFRDENRLRPRIYFTVHVGEKQLHFAATVKADRVTPRVYEVDSIPWEMWAGSGDGPKGLIHGDDPPAYANIHQNQTEEECAL